MGRASALQTARRLVGALILAALVCLTLGVFFKPEPPPRVVPPSPADLVRQKLQQIISLDVAGQPLEDVLAELERKHGLRIELNRESLGSRRLSAPQKVTLRLRNVRLGSAIELLLMQLEPQPEPPPPPADISAGLSLQLGRGLTASDRVEYGIVGDGIRIVSADDADQLAVTKIYTLPLWLATDPELSEEYLGEAAKRPALWQTVPGALVVARPQRLEDEIADSLEAIARIAEAPFAPPPKEPSPAEAAIARALGERTLCDFQETAFSDVLAYLSDLHNVNIVMDPARIAEANVPPSTEITFRAPGITLRAALKQILHDLGLSFLIEHDAIIVTSKEVADTRLVARVYSARDLMSQRVYPPSEDLRDFITSCVHPENWKEAGGPATMVPVPGGLLVNAEARTHEELPRFLDWLRRALDPFVADYDALNRSPAELRLSRALDRNVSLDVNDSAFRDVIRSLSDQAGVPLVIAQKKIEEANVQLDTPITKELRDVPLRTALKAILRELGLDYIVRDEVILITSKEEHDTYLTIGIYRYRPVGIAPHRLRKMLTDYILPDSWKEAGGPGTMDLFGDVLVIWTTRQVHEDCQELMTTLARLRDLPADTATGKTCRPVNRSPAERRLDEALDRKMSLEFNETALKDVIVYLSELTGARLAFAEKKLQEANVQLDTPVTKKLRDVPLRTALESILHDLGLDFIVRDDAILVTSKEEHDTHYTLGIYDCRPVGIEPRRLRAILTDHIRPESWKDAEGPGTVSVFEDFLFIATTREVHEECQGLLTKLAQFRSGTADPAAAEAERERWLRELQRQRNGWLPLSAPPPREKSQ